MSRFYDLFQPEGVPDFVLRRFKDLWPYIIPPEGIVFDEATQKALTIAMEKEYCRRKKFPTTALCHVFSLLSSEKLRERLSLFVLKNISERTVEARDVVSLVHHMPTHFHRHLFPYVPPSSEFYRGLNNLSKDFYHIFILFELRSIFEIPSDVLRLIIPHFKNWLIQDEYLDWVVAKLDTCSWNHITTYMMPFFSSRFVPDYIKPLGMNVIAHRRVADYPEVVPDFISYMTLGTLLRCYLSLKQVDEGTEDLIRMTIVNKLSPPDKSQRAKAPIVIGRPTTDWRGASLIDIDIFYPDGDEPEEEQLRIPLLELSKWEKLKSTLFDLITS